MLCSDGPGAEVLKPTSGAAGGVHATQTRWLRMRKGGSPKETGEPGTGLAETQLHVGPRARHQPGDRMAQGPWRCSGVSQASFSSWWGRGY